MAVKFRLVINQTENEFDAITNKKLLVWFYKIGQVRKPLVLKNNSVFQIIGYETKFLATFD